MCVCLCVRSQEFALFFRVLRGEDHYHNRALSAGVYVCCICLFLSTSPLFCCFSQGVCDSSRPAAFSLIILYISLHFIGTPILALLSPPRAPLMFVCLFGRRGLEHEGRVDKPAKAAASDARPASSITCTTAATATAPGADRAAEGGTRWAA